MLADAIGGSLHQERKFEAGMLDSSECLRCRDGSDSTLHRARLRSCNGGGKAVEESDFLAPRVIV
eukprot:5310677-Pyramimonas_sp.AAC.1